MAFIKNFGVFCRLFVGHSHDCIESFYISLYLVHCTYLYFWLLFRGSNLLALFHSKRELSYLVFIASMAQFGSTILNSLGLFAIKPAFFRFVFGAWFLFIDQMRSSISMLKVYHSFTGRTGLKCFPSDATKDSTQSLKTSKIMKGYINILMKMKHSSGIIYTT